jgi:hypothetical protein
LARAAAPRTLAPTTARLTLRLTDILRIAPFTFALVAALFTRRFAFLTARLLATPTSFQATNAPMTGSSRHASSLRR